MEIQNYQVGDSYSATITVEEETINKFAEITGDKNPVHLDEEFAGKTFLKRRIAHGFLYGSYISRILGTEFPGIGTIYISQLMEFLKPVYIGDQLKINIRIIELLSKNRLRLETNIENQEQVLVLKGEAVVMKVIFSL